MCEMSFSVKIFWADGREPNVYFTTGSRQPTEADVIAAWVSDPSQVDRVEIVELPAVEVESNLHEFVEL